MTRPYASATNHNPESNAANDPTPVESPTSKEPTSTTEGEQEALTPEQERIAALEAQLAASEARLTQTLTQYKEALSDFEQAKARLKRDIHKEIEAGKRHVLISLLEVLDNLERAVAAAQQANQASEAPLLAGVTMVQSQFSAKLESLGVQQVPLLGLPFDPTCSEAVSTIPCEDPDQDGLVLAVMTPCYRAGDTILRHGIVAVGRHQGT